MEISSNAFGNNEKMPSRYTCDGDNISPPLQFSNIPAEAKSLVLIMDDPDAIKPAGKIWDHWIIFNINPETANIPEGTNPKAILGKNTRGKNAYGGPCPPDAQHRYFFKLYALDIMLNLQEGATKAEVEKAMHEHILEQAQLIGLYERNK